MTRKTDLGGKGQSKTANKMSAAERARKAMMLRAARVSYDQIALQLGYANRSSAFNAVKRELAKIPREAAKELRIVELESLDSAERALSRRVANGDLQAIDRMLRIKDQRAKLTGMYEEQADTGVDEVKEVLAAWLGKVQAEVDDEDDEDGEYDGVDDDAT